MQYYLIVRISELASRSGVPLSAVKFYQRQGLIPAGVLTAPNQADYNDEHVRRVRLIRALLECGGLSIASAKKVIAALDDKEIPLGVAFEVGQRVVSTPRTTESPPSERSRQRIVEFIDSQGWVVDQTNPGIDMAARALDAYTTIHSDDPVDYLETYARAAEIGAKADMRELARLTNRDDMIELLVVGTILGDKLFAAFRRLVHEDQTYVLVPTDVDRHYARVS